MSQVQTRIKTRWIFQHSDDDVDDSADADGTRSRSVGDIESDELYH